MITLADWKLYTARDDIARAMQPDLSADWREWNSVLSDIARAEEGKGDVMSAGYLCRHPIAHDRHLRVFIPRQSAAVGKLDSIAGAIAMRICGVGPRASRARCALCSPCWFPLRVTDLLL